MIFGRAKLYQRIRDIFRHSRVEGETWKILDVNIPKDPKGDVAYFFFTSKHFFSNFSPDHRFKKFVWRLCIAGWGYGWAARDGAKAVLRRRIRTVLCKLKLFQMEAISRGSHQNVRRREVNWNMIRADAVSNHIKSFDVIKKAVVSVVSYSFVVEEFNSHTCSMVLEYLPTFAL